MYPEQPDVDVSTASTSALELKVDLNDVLCKVLRGRVSDKVYPAWDPVYRPSLMSAISGGQWPQARLAQANGLVDESSCQLCFAAIGTLMHKHQCPATLPHAGWPRPPEHVQRFIDDLSPSRQMLRRAPLIEAGRPDAAMWRYLRVAARLQRQHSA